MYSTTNPTFLQVPDLKKHEEQEHKQLQHKKPKQKTTKNNIHYLFLSFFVLRLCVKISPDITHR